MAAVPPMIALAVEAPALPRDLALKALDRIGRAWGLPRQDVPTLLARAPRTVRDWFERDRGPLDPDVLERIVHLIGMYDGLHRLFGDAEYADAWVHQPNRAFGDQPPIDLLLTGKFTALVEVRRYIQEALSH
jgi:uncharacterized protein (DUF2384 family)